MADDRSRYGDSKTQVHTKKIQIRMASGKIYGPYGRTEVLGFIHAKKLKGQEEILFDGESEWRAISSDLEFFDAFQDRLMGRGRRLDKPSKGEGSQETKIAQASSKKSLSLPKTSVSAPDTAEGPLTRTHLLRDKTNTLTESPGAERDALPSPSSGGVELHPAFDTDSGPIKNKTLKKPGIKWALIVGIAVSLGALATLFSFKAAKKDFSNIRELKFNHPLRYAKSLQIMTAGLQVKIPSLPQKIQSQQGLNLAQGFGANIWAQDLIKLSAVTDPEEKLSVSYWARWSWNLQWMGEVIFLFQPDLGKHLKETGFAVYEELEKQKVLSPEQKTLFQSLPAIFEGKWQVAQNKLESLKDNELGLWLAELCSWMAFWERGGTGPIFRSSLESYSSLNLDVPSRIRRALVEQDPKILQFVQALAVEDPLDFGLWFNLAEYAWRLGKNNIQLANRFFITGLPTLAFVPASFQKVYWDQFQAFLLVFGRKSSSDQAALNASLLKKNNLSEGSLAIKQWWDLGQEGLGFEAIAQDILERARRDDLSALDMASLRAMAFVAPNGTELLNEAGNYLSFDGYFSKAKVLYEVATKIKNDNVESWGGLVWSEAGLHRFDKAAIALDRVGTFKSETPEVLKYQGLLEIYGREYENAEKHLQEYSKAAPADAWGHYFRALLNEKLENTLECSKAANLARIHAQGLLNKRATMLLFRCKILARIQVRATIEELKKLQALQPNSIPVNVELIEALANADLMDQAQSFAEQSLLRFPRSYELRVKLAEIYERRNNVDAAVAFYNDAKKDRPDSAVASIRIARIMEKEGRLNEAVQNLETAARMDPTYPELWLMAARLYEKLGRVNDAQLMYAREIDERPAALSSFVEAAEFMLKINAPQEVPKIFQKFSADYQADSRVLTRLAQAYWAMKDKDNARQTAALALKSNPNSAQAHRVLGFLYEDQGQYEMAKKHFEGYLQNLPQAPDGDEIRGKLSAPPFSR